MSGVLRLANKQSQHSTSTYVRREIKGTKMIKKVCAYGRKKEIKEVGTYEVKFNKQLRGQKVTFFYYNLF